MSNFLDGGDINFDNKPGGESIQNVSSEVSHIGTKLYNLKNPYIGNKRRLIKKMLTIIDDNNIKYNSVLDLFSGSSFVSIALKMLGKKVISNELLTCSYFNAVAFVKNRDIKLTKEDKDFLFSTSKNSEIFIDRKYLNRFSERELSIIENYYQNIFNRWGNPLEGNIKAVLAVVYMQNYIMEKCFVGGRLNSGQILSSYEHRVNHIKNKKGKGKIGSELFLNGKTFSYADIKWTNPLFIKDTNNHDCYNMDSIDFLNIVKPDVDLCYIDPPYGGDQSDYGFMYSFFEELIYRCSFEEIKKERKGFDRFINKKNYKNNFEELISRSNYIPTLVLSYNNNSWGDVDTICNIIYKYKKSVKVIENSYFYKYRDKKNNNSETKEYIIIAKE